MRAAIALEVDRLNAIEDPIARIQAVGELFNGLDDAVVELGNPRLNALLELQRDGWSYNRIVEATSLSKGRVSQLVHEARRRRDR